MHKDTSVSTKQTPPHDAVQPPETASAPPEAVQPPATARVVIIGGGIMGCGLAYHLAGEGCSDVVLLEKGELTSGSTWHAAGQITYATSSYTLAKCVAYNLDLYRRLEAETGQSVTFHGCGSLRMAYDEDEVDWHRHILAIVAGLELPAEILSVEEARRLHPFYNFAGIRAALHTPEDGHADPAGIAFALAKGARMRGVHIARRCRVVGVSRLPSGEWLVSTERGDIRCEHVANAGGTYARQMALWNGYDLPTTSMTHHYFVTEPVPEFKELEKELPVVRDDRHVSGYIRMEQKSGLIGIYEKQNTNTVWTDETPWESENELFDPDYERVSPWLEAALERVPIFAPLGIRRAVHGAISHPPDGNPLIGPAPGLRNYWCCCGCQIGIGWGPALTRELARWILHGAADFNMREFDPRRFGAYADSNYQIAKGKEDYSLRHEIPFPHFSRLARRGIKKSALYERLKEQGAVFEEVYGWERPRWFAAGDVAAQDIYSFRRIPPLHNLVGAEVAAVRACAGLIDISAFAKIEVAGADAAAFVDRLIPNRLPVAGRIALTHLLSAHGRIEVEATVSRLDEERFYFACAAFFEQRLLDYFSAAVEDIGEVKVNIINRSEEWAALAINGTLSRRILAAVAKEDVADAAFPWLRVKQLSIGEHRLWALRLSYAGELGWELHGEKSAIAAAYDALWNAGAADGIVNYGSFAMNSMRMEKAFMGAGELTNEVTLPEVDAMRFVRMDKTDFAGKAATIRAADKKRWQCVYLEVDDDGEHDGSGSEGVFAGYERTGVVSSIAFGHSVGKLLAFAYVQERHVDAPLHILIDGEKRAARVLSAPAFDPQNNRPRQK